MYASWARPIAAATKTIENSGAYTEALSVPMTIHESATPTLSAIVAIVPMIISTIGDKGLRMKIYF
jgi:hypothetical protein